MTRKTKEPEEATGIEEFGMDEVDSFADAREHELIKKAGLDKEDLRFSDSDDESEIEGVMDVDSDAEIEKYKKKFQGAIDESDEEYFREEGDVDDEDDEQDEKWGGDYYGAEDAEDEEDEKLLEAEALRLQKKHMEDLHMGDFMLDEVEEWKSNKRTDFKEKKEDKLEEMVRSGSKQDRMNIISKKYPEYLPLISEMKTYKPVYDELKKCYTEKPILSVQFKALSLYLGAITSYFSIFVNKLQSGEPFDMRDEDVMVSILSTRELWRQASALIEYANSEEEEEEEDDDDNGTNYGEENEQVSDQEEMDAEEPKLEKEINSAKEVEDLSEQEYEDDEEEGGEEEEEEETPDFDTLRSIKKKDGKKLEGMDDIDAEDKQGRRKSLRFYTSKIDKRDLSKVSVDGDMDAAYLEASQKQKDKQFVQEKREQRNRKNHRGRNNRFRK